MKVVSPYRQFAPESAAHLRLGPFDWVAALRMLRISVRQACACQTVALTDVDTNLPVPAYQYVTRHRRLMLWIVEVCLRYLESDDFDQDTVMLSPDLLVFRELSQWFSTGADLGVLVRLGEKYRERRPLLNEAQWWRHAAKPALIAFYRQALTIAEALPDNYVRWGADTEPLRQLLSPLEPGVVVRAGLRVQMIEAQTVLGKRLVPPMSAIVDFKYLSKVGMADYFHRTLGAA